MKHPHLFVCWLTPFLVCMLAGGCTSAPLAPGKAPEPASAVVNMPAKDVFDAIKRIVSAPPINLGVTEERDGILFTTYQRHQGTFHIGRHWQEQTRYRIAVAPDFNDPAGRSRIEVTAQTEERAAEGQSWDPNPSLYRPERAQAVLSAITSQLKPT